MGRRLLSALERAAWFGALIEQRPSRLRYSGDRRLGRELVAAIAWALFDERAYAH